MIDSATIGLLTAFSSSALALAMLMLFAIRHKEKSILPMAVSNFLFSLSVFLLLVQAALPRIIGNIASNALFMLSVVIYGIAIGFLLKAQYPVLLSLISWAAGTVLIILFTYVFPAFSVRVHTVNGFIAFQIALVVVSAVKRRKIIPKPIFAFWMVTQMLYGTVVLVRSVVYLSPSVGDSLWSNNSSTVLILLALFFMILFSNIGYILMLAFRYYRKTENLLKKVRHLNRTLLLDVKNKTQDLNEANKQLMVSEKMASLGVFTAGIAHELNNPVNYIALGIPSLERDIRVLDEYCSEMKELILATGDRQAEEILRRISAEYKVDEMKEEIPLLLHGIKKGVEKTVSIIESLRSFSKPDTEEMQMVDLVESMESSLLILNHFIDDDITIEKDFQPVPEFRGYPGKIGQVFINVLHNAIQAIYEKEERGNDSIRISIGLDQADSSKACVKIRDSGIGIAEDHLGQIFDPFFTRKEEGQGTGLGLSIVHRIIEDHSGIISVNSRLNEGTEFSIELPVT